MVGLPAAQSPVAIVGMAVLLPGAPDLETYWRNLVDGVDSISAVPAGRWDPNYYDPTAGPTRPDRIYCNRGGFVDDYATIDAAGFGIMPNSVAGSEPDQLLALRVAAAAIEDAGGPERMPAGDRVGVVLGRGGYLTSGIARLDQRVRTAAQLTRTLAQVVPGISAADLEAVRAAFTDELGPHSPESAIGLVPNLAASRIANRLDFRGPAYTVDAACASSLIAVDQAVTELARGRCDAVLAGGVHHCHDVTFWSVFCQLGALSRTQQIRPFDRAADGILIGEGTGVVVLKRLKDALAAGDRIYAVIRGTGVSSDGRSASLFSPAPGGQMLALRRAWQAAGLDPRAPDSIGLLEAHGTATVAGDGAELDTLEEVFGPGNPAVIGSVKSMIGHTMPAAGVAGLVKAALALHRSVLLPTLHCEDPHPQLARTRFAPIATAQPWEQGAVPRRAAVNAFGFGGINAHVVLEQAPTRTTAVTTKTVTTKTATRQASGPTPIAAARPERVLRLAASDPLTLADLLVASGADIGVAEPGEAPCRLAIVDPTPKKLALAARILAKGVAWHGRSDIWFSPKPLLPGGRVAFVFPGLEADFAPQIEDIRTRLDGTADTGEQPGAHGYDLGQHGLGVVEVGRLLERALAQMDIRPDAVAGHSVGEWSAMISAGIYSREQIDRFIVEFDPQSLEVPGVVFAAVGAGADNAKVLDALVRFPQVVLSHDNAPNQCVLCGPQADIGELVRVLRAGNVLCQELPFRSGFHTPMLEPYLAPIRAGLEGFDLQPPHVQIWSATTAAPFPAETAAVREIFLRHLLEPVRFRALINAMYADSVRVFIQVGTGQLASVIDDVLREKDHLAIAANSAARPGLAQLRRVAAALWAEGAAVDQTLLEPAAAPSSSSVRAPMALDLSAALVDLPLANRPSFTGGGDFRALEALAAQVPAAAEFAALLRETAAGAVTILKAVTALPVPTLAPPPPAAAPQAPIALPPRRVSLEAMPYLVDHCFFKQREGWPEIADRWPVVPATTVISLLMQAAEQASPGRRAIAVTKARFHRWIVATPPSDIAVQVAAVDADRVAIRLGDYAEAVVELAAIFPQTAPAPMQLDNAGAPPSPITAAQLYSERWMFHGPQFQAVTQIGPIGAEHISATLIGLAAPGALLDNVGQVLGYWIMASHTHRTVVFPQGMGKIAFYGAEPAPGTAVTCLVKIVSLTDTELVADAQLVVNGRVWVDIEGWVDRRFDSHPATRPVDMAPDRNTLSVAQPGGWVLLHERWRDLASRELYLRNYCGQDERADYEAIAPKLRRAHLLGRIAVKDAVRLRLFAAGSGPIFPAEVRVGNDEAGRPTIAGHHTDAVPALSVSLAHSAESAVAIVGAPGTRVGIDLQADSEHPPSTWSFALSGAERDLIDDLVAQGTDSPATWFTRFFAAKEAVSKAEGTGLLGNPKHFAVVRARAHELTVLVGQRTYLVATAAVRNPDDLPERTYIVAWTEYLDPRPPSDGAP